MFSEVTIGIELAVYSVMEGVLGFVEVCITVAEEQSLDHGYGSAVINISTSTGTATGDDVRCLYIAYSESFE